MTEKETVKRINQREVIEPRGEKKEGEGYWIKEKEELGGGTRIDFRSDRNLFTRHLTNPSKMQETKASKRVEDWNSSS
jgi:hypothetical protein